MKKLLFTATAVLASAGALATTAVPAQAAATPDTVLCLGNQDAAGGFTTSNIAGLPTCVDLSAGRIADMVTADVAALTGTGLPTALPTATDLQNVITALSGADLSDPLGALTAAFQVCSALHADLTCGPVLAGALVLVATRVGTSGVINTTGRGLPCGRQQAFGPYVASTTYILDWTVVYPQSRDGSLRNPLGVVSGAATTADAQQIHPLTGIIGPNCGPGLKVLVLNLR